LYKKQRKGQGARGKGIQEGDTYKFFVLRPQPHRNRQNLLGNIHIPCLLSPFLQTRPRFITPFDDIEGFVEELVVFVGVAVVGDGIVGWDQGHVPVFEFGPAAGFGAAVEGRVRIVGEMGGERGDSREALVYEFWPVEDGAS
jgi:hypothetical protein